MDSEARKKVRSLILAANLAMVCVVVWVIYVVVAFAQEIPVFKGGNHLGNIRIESYNAWVNGNNLLHGELIANFYPLNGNMNMIDGLNMDWLQIVRNEHVKMKDANGNNLNSPHVDPPSGGYQGTPDDNKPPYWTANERKAAILNNANCFTFSDGPQTSGNLRHFELFLVDIYGNQIQIKAGLNWGIYRNASGGAEKFPVTPHVYNGNNYPNDLDNVVNHDFPGWHVAKLTTLTPMVLPVATLLLVLALMGLAIWVLSRTKTDAA